MVQSPTLSSTLLVLSQWLALASRSRRSCLPPRPRLPSTTDHPLALLVRCCTFAGLTLIIVTAAELGERPENRPVKSAAGNVYLICFGGSRNSEMTGAVYSAPPSR